MNKKLLSLLIIIGFIFLTSYTVVLANDEKTVETAEEIQQEIESNKITENEISSNKNDDIDNEKKDNLIIEEEQVEQEVKQNNTQQEEKNDSQNQQENNNETEEIKEVIQTQEQQGIKDEEESGQDKEQLEQEDISLIKGNIENETEGEENQEQSRNVEEVEEQNEEFSIYVDVLGNRINPYVKNGINYLFVPKSGDLNDLEIYYTGIIESISGAEFDQEKKQITGIFSNESAFSFRLKDGTLVKVVIIQSDVPAIFVNLDNDVTLETVNSNSKDIKYQGSVNVKGCDNSKNDIPQTEIEFKGRGNTSWGMPKKSYQIKLSKKVNFLGIGDSKEKKWVLIANYQDPTLLKNKIMNDLCVESGLSSCPNSLFADLYVNGNYVGNYLVCDKIEINDNRVNLENEKGVLVELDNAYYREEEYWFQTSRGNHYTIKEAVSEKNEEMVRNAMNSFKQALNKFETELYSDNPSWDKISKMIDVDSFVKYYVINDFAEDMDSYYSSCFLYKDGDDDVIHMGPTWDYDAAFGHIAQINDTSADFTLNYAFRNVMQRIYIFPEFANRVNEVYTTNIKPILDKINVNSLSKSIKQSSKINTLVWYDENTYLNKINHFSNFFNNRKNYFDKRYSNENIEYSTHVQNIGWLQSTNNKVSGTEGRSLRLEGIKVKIGSGYGENVSVSYRTHIQNIGWQDWKKDGELSGTTGLGLRLEAIQLMLNDTSKYSIRYRVHIQNIGWTDWIYDGNVAGTEGQSLRLEAIEIQIVEKRDNYGTTRPNSNALIKYKGHIENVGDTGYGIDGEKIGTIGRGLRLEGLQIELGNSLPSDLSLSINEHIENIGWKYGLTNKDYIGTQGRSLRLEALSFKLNGESAKNYTIKYRVHVQNIGWQDWKKDGEIAGTTGQSLRIEAIQILIEPK